MNKGRDIYNLEKRWDTWKKENSKGIKEVSKHNSELIIQLLTDMEQGKNISPKTKKGERSYHRLLSLKDRLTFFAKKFKKDFEKLSKDDVHKLITDMRKGKLLKKDGKPYIATGEYVKDIKTLVGWLRRTGRIKEDIAEDLARRDGRKPVWVYLTEKQFKTLANRCNPDYKTLAWFFYDAGCRVKEGFSVKVNDFTDDYKKLQLREENAKTFGRKINLKICSKLVKEYIEHHNLKPEDYFIQQKPASFNKYIRILAGKLFGDGVSESGEHYNKFSAYDIRHNSSCYWLVRYPKTPALMYRMGWTKETEVKYYSEFKGLRDEITDEDMILSEDKSEMEKRIALLEDDLHMAKDVMEKAVKQNIKMIKQNQEYIRVEAKRLLKESMKQHQTRLDA